MTFQEIYQDVKSQANTFIEDIAKLTHRSKAAVRKWLGMHRNTLLKYANKGIIKTGIRRSNSRRFYLGREIIRFWKAQL